MRSRVAAGPCEPRTRPANAGQEPRTPADPPDAGLIEFATTRPPLPRERGLEEWRADTGMGIHGTHEARETD
jgi:hypothetical protein